MIRFLYLMMGYLALVGAALGGIVLITMTFKEGLPDEVTRLQLIAVNLSLLISLVAFGNVDRLNQQRREGD